MLFETSMSALHCNYYFKLIRSLFAEPKQEKKKDGTANRNNPNPALLSSLNKLLALGGNCEKCNSNPLIEIGEGSSLRYFKPVLKFEVSDRNFHINPGLIIMHYHICRYGTWRT